MNTQTTSRAGAVVDRFLDALTARDFETLAGCLEPSAQARLLLPRGPDDVVGNLRVSARMEGWFGAAAGFEVISRDSEEIGGRQRASWRFRVLRDGQSWELIEQTAFIDVGPDGIQRIDLLCSGFRPEGSEAAQPPAAQ